MRWNPPTPRRLSARNSAHMDVVRSAATIAVVAAHTRRLFFTSHQVEWRGLTLLSDIGMTIANESVMVFFVLSGFFISAIVMKGGKSWSWKKYLLDRGTRLYVVYLPALLFTWVIDQLTLRFQYAAPIWQRIPEMFGTAPLAEHYTWSVFLGNLAFLQTVTVPAFGSDFPLWSLSSEFWYYMVFPCMFFAVYAGSKKKAVLPALGAVLFAVLLPHRIVKYFAVWLLGVAVQVAPSMKMPLRAQRGLQAMLAMCTIAMLFVPVVHTLEIWRLDALFGAVFSLWMYTVVRVEASDAPADDGKPVSAAFRRYQTTGSTMAGFSYSVYVTHFPILLCVRCFLGGEDWKMSPATVASAIGLVGFTLIFAWGFSRLTEAHTQKVRTWLNTSPWSSLTHLTPVRRTSL